MSHRTAIRSRSHAHPARIGRLLCAGLAAAVGLAASARASSLLKQDLNALQGYTASYDPGSVSSNAVADDFTLPTGATIHQVRWWGYSDEFTLINLLNFNEFKVTIYQRGPGGAPGAVLYQEAFATTNTAPVNTGLVSSVGSAIWQQTVTLGTPQSLAAGTYLVSVGPSSYANNQGSIWYWNASLQGNGFLMYDAYDGVGWRQYPVSADVAFELFGVPHACYANCDDSTTPPVLNVADFTCFLQKYALGCT